MSSKRRRPPYQSQIAPLSPKSSSASAGPSVPPPPTEPATPEHAVTPVHGDRIGDILRRVREHRGEDIESISDYLRIRPSFLIALENSRYDEIPADTYVIGFLRTYSLYLGLDGKGAIEQYRREMAGRRRAPQLTMPQPMSEGRIPTFAILLAATIACIVIYGLWYGLSTPDRDVIAQPVPLPSANTEGEASPATEALAASPAGDLLLETTTGANAAISTLAATAAANSQQPQPSATSEQPAKPVAEETSPPQEDGDSARSFGAKGKTRVVIKAEKESWILITDTLGTTLFDRTLKPGESYNVPAGRDLRLTSGNAGGLLLTLDGAALPRMKTTGQVVRDVILTPEKLKTRLPAAPPASEKTPEEPKPSDPTPVTID